MAVKIIKEKKLSWIYIDKVDSEALSYLNENYNFHHLDLEDLQSESQTPKIDAYKNYLFLVLQFPHWQANTKKVISHELDVFIGQDYLITIQHARSKELKNFFYKCMKNKKTKANWMRHSSGYLLYKIIEALFQNSQPILNNIGKQLAALEENIFDGVHDEETVKQLSINRRNILAYRRIIDPQKYLISNLTHIRTSFLNEKLALYFDNVNDFLNKVWSILESYKDMVAGLHVTVESLISRRTNKIIETLTIISVGLLPLTLLAGIYGMNIRLPYASNPRVIWLMFGILLLIIGFALTMMKRKKQL